jgi:hypothetical protein
VPTHRRVPRGSTRSPQRHMKAATEMQKLPSQIGDPDGCLRSRGVVQHNDAATSGEPADRMTRQRPPRASMTTSTPSGARRASPPARVSRSMLTISIARNSSSEAAVDAFASLQPSIASAADLAEAFGSLLPLTARGEVVPPSTDPFHSRRLPRRCAISSRITFRQGGPGRRRTLRLAPHERAAAPLASP